MTTIASLADSFAYQFPSVPTPMMQEAVRDAVHKFLSDTQLATDYVRMKTYANTYEYIVQLPECRRLFRVKAVRWGDDYNDMPAWQQDRKIPYEMDGNQQALRLLDNWYLYNNATGSSECCNAEDERDIEVEYAWTTRHNDCELPENIFDLYMVELLHLVRYFIYSMAEQEWTSIQGADKYMRDYMDLLSKIRTRVLNGFSSTPKKMKATGFLRGFTRSARSGRL